MASLKDTLAYLLIHYSHSRHLSVARVTKMVYLADWKHSIQEKCQVTDIRWKYNHYGPYVSDVVDEAKEHPDLFSYRLTTNVHGSKKQLLGCNEKSYNPSISESEKAALNHVIESTQPLSWGRFIKLVYSTWPVVSHDQYDYLDLPKAAEEYRDTDYFLTYQATKQQSEASLATVE